MNAQFYKTTRTDNTQDHSWNPTLSQKRCLQLSAELFTEDGA